MRKFLSRVSEKPEAQRTQFTDISPKTFISSPFINLELAIDQFRLVAIEKYKERSKALDEIQTFCTKAKDLCSTNFLLNKDIVSTANEILAFADTLFTPRFNLKSIFINILFGCFTLGMGFFIKKGLTGNYFFTAEETSRKKSLKFFINPKLVRSPSPSEQLSSVLQTKESVEASDSQGSSISNKKVYLHMTYSSTHWAYHIPAVGDDNFIAIVKIFGIKMAITLNSTDARGYRAIVKLVDDNMKSTFNREYSDTEKSALSIALALMSSLYEDFGMAINTEIAGNNSQSVHDGVIQMGNAHEPSILHGHIIGRGNPTTCYISDVPLRGPEAGLLFNMRGNNNLEPGNDKKIPWTPQEMECIANILAERLPRKIGDSMLFQKIISIDLLRLNCEPDSTASSARFFSP